MDRPYFRSQTVEAGSSHEHVLKEKEKPGGAAATNVSAYPVTNDMTIIHDAHARITTDTLRISGSQADAPASVTPVTGQDANAHGWGCWLCGIHEDAPTTDLARIRIITHVAAVHGDLVDLARKRNDPSAVVPQYRPGLAPSAPGRTAPPARTPAPQPSRARTPAPSRAPTTATRPPRRRAS
jgi:hypothetical protein